LTEIAVKLTERPVKLTEISVKLSEIAVKLTEIVVRDTLDFLLKSLCLFFLFRSSRHVLISRFCYFQYGALLV